MCIHILGLPPEVASLQGFFPRNLEINASASYEHDSFAAPHHVTCKYAHLCRVRPILKLCTALWPLHSSLQWCQSNGRMVECPSSNPHQSHKSSFTATQPPRCFWRTYRREVSHTEMHTHTHLHYRGHSGVALPHVCGKGGRRRGWETWESGFSSSPFYCVQLCLCLYLARRSPTVTDDPFKTQRLLLPIESFPW